MARKQVITQRDFGLLEVREEFLERDDLEARARALRGARNLRQVPTGAVQARPGLLYKRQMPSTSREVFEIRPADGEVFGLLLRNAALSIFDEDGRIVKSITGAPWTSSDTLWVTPVREETLIGGDHGISVLRYDDGVWTLSEWAFAPGPGGELSQPYWAFEKNVTLRPSATTGNIKLTASSPVFTPGHVGLRIRWHQREVTITKYVTASVVRGTVVNDLPPSFRITLDDASGFRVDETVRGADTGYEGIVTRIEGDTIWVATLSYFDGPHGSATPGGAERLASSSTSSKIGTVTKVAPEASLIWDEPMMSDVRGWPRSGTTVNGRLALLNFPLIPDGVAVSSARDFTDFRVGADDDDAIARQVGDDSPRFLHAINAGDLLLLSDRGCYLVALRDNGVLTPSNFNAVLFDKRGASEVRPVSVADGVVFVEAGGRSVVAALLDGNVYLKWSVRTLTEFHYHLVRDPVALCGPATNSVLSEQFVFIINGDGTLAVVSFSLSLKEDRLGFAPWDTDGTFINVAPVFGRYWAIVDRTINGATVRLLEMFDDDTYLDSAVSTSQASSVGTLTVNGAPLTVNGETLIVQVPLQTHLAGRTVHYFDADNYVGTFTVNADGTVDGEPSPVVGRQIGLNFTAEAQVWPAENIEVPRAGIVPVRTTRLIVSMQDSLLFQVRCNAYTREVGGYDFGAHLGTPPERQTRLYRVPVFGRRDHPDLAVIKHKPGPFRILSIGQEVQV